MSAAQKLAGLAATITNDGGTAEVIFGEKSIFLQSVSQANAATLEGLDTDEQRVMVATDKIVAVRSVPDEPLPIGII